MAFMTFNEYKKQQAKQREIDKYKMDNSRYGAMNDAMDNSSYADSMAKAYENALAYKNSTNEDDKRWKLLADQARTNQAYDDNATIERQKELLAIRAKKKKIIQEIDELKKELQQRTKLQAFEDKYKDSPFWKLAKKHYIDTGDMGAIDSFITRENALQEAMANREFTGRENELNRSNTSELNKAQKTEQLEYDLDDAQAKVELAQNKLKSAKALGVPVDKKDAQIAFNSAVKRLNKIRGKLGMGDSEYELEEYDNTNESSGNKERPVQDILLNIPTNFRYNTNDEKKEAMEEIEAHSAFNDTQDKSLRDAYQKIRDTKTQEQINAEKAKVNADRTNKINAYNSALANYSKYFKPMTDVANPEIKNLSATDEELDAAENAITSAFNNLPKDQQDEAKKKHGNGKEYYKRIGSK